MNLENQAVSKRAERIFESICSLVTGSVGVFLAFIFIWCLQGEFKRNEADWFGIIFLLAYWFLKMTYKLAFHKCEYLLSSAELKVFGWFFILLPPCGAVLYLLNGQVADLYRYLPGTLPGLVYGYFALKVAKDRKTVASNQEDAPDQKAVR
jgi:hypothetical protein